MSYSSWWFCHFYARLEVCSPEWHVLCYMFALPASEVSFLGVLAHKLTCITCSFDKFICPFYARLEVCSCQSTPVWHAMHDILAFTSFGSLFLRYLHTSQQGMLLLTCMFLPFSFWDMIMHMQLRHGFVRRPVAFAEHTDRAKATLWCWGLIVIWGAEMEKHSNSTGFCVMFHAVGMGR